MLPGAKSAVIGSDFAPKKPSASLLLLLPLLWAAQALVASRDNAGDWLSGKSEVPEVKFGRVSAELEVAMSTLSAAAAAAAAASWPSWLKADSSWSLSTSAAAGLLDTGVALVDFRNLVINLLQFREVSAANISASICSRYLDCAASESSSIGELLRRALTGAASTTPLVVASEFV
jgi:hypothetical protein